MQMFWKSLYKAGIIAMSVSFISSKGFNFAFLYSSKTHAKSYI